MTMKTYLDLLQHVLDNGTEKTDRTGTGTLSVFGHQMRFDLTEGFPLVTTKKVHMKSIIVELLWFLRGDTNTKFLHDHGVTIWDEWQKPDGELGPVYGSQWRSWPTYYQVNSPYSNNHGSFEPGEGIDQIAEVINTLKTNPDSRRIIVSAWNVADIGRMALPPCHAFFQFYTEELTEMERLLLSEQIGIRNVVSNHGEDLADTMTRYGIPTRRLSCQLYQR